MTDYLLNGAFTEEVLGFCRQSSNKVSEAADRYIVKEYCSIEAMVVQWGVEAAIICSLHPVHAANALLTGYMATGRT